MRHLRYLIVLLLMTPGAALAQRSLDLAVNGVGLSIGDSREITGIRLNFRDRALRRVTGINATIWMPYNDRGGDITGMALGLPATGGENITGLGLALLGVGANDSIDGIMIAGLGAGAGKDIRGIAIGGLGVGAGRNVTGITIGGLGAGAGGDFKGITLAGLGAGAGEDATGIVMAGLGAGGDFTGASISGFATGAGETLR